MNKPNIETNTASGNAPKEKDLGKQDANTRTDHNETRVALVWSDGQVTIVPMADVEKYRAIYGEYPTSLRLSQSTVATTANN